MWSGVRSCHKTGKGTGLRRITAQVFQVLHHLTGQRYDMRLVVLHFEAGDAPLPLLPANLAPFSPCEGTGPQKDVWRDSQSCGYFKAALLGHGAVQSQEELAHFVRAGDGGKASIRVRTLKGKPFPDGISRVVLALSHGYAEVENAYSVLGNLAQGCRT